MFSGKNPKNILFFFVQPIMLEMSIVILTKCEIFLQIEKIHILGLYGFSAAGSYIVLRTWSAVDKMTTLLLPIAHIQAFDIFETVSNV